MAEKDIIEKKLEDYNYVFADILNVLLFEYDYINPEELIDGDTESIYKAEYSNLRNQYRVHLNVIKMQGLLFQNLV